MKHAAMRSCRAMRPAIASVLSILILVSLGSSCRPRSAVPLRVGLMAWPGVEGLYLARDLGKFQGASIQLVEYPAVSEVLRAFQNGAIDVAVVTGGSSMLLAQSRNDAVIILVMDFSNGADVILAQREFKSMRDLKGKRIGAELTGLGGMMLVSGLEHNAMSQSDVQIVPIPPWDQERAFLAREVDALATYEPRRSRLLAAGANEVFSSSQIPREIVDLMVVRKSQIEGNSHDLGALVRGWFAARDHVSRSPEDAFALISKRVGLAVDQLRMIEKLMEFPDRETNKRLLSGSDPSLVNSMGRLSSSMIDRGLLQKKVEVKELLDDRFVR